MKFNWIKTSKKLPPTHVIILFVDKWDNFHYGVLCSELSNKGRKNKYWCHIFNKSYHKKDIDLWCLVDEMGAMKILYPNRFKEEHYEKLKENIYESQMKIEQEIIAEAKLMDYEKCPAVIIRNCLHRFSCEILKINIDMKRGN